MDNNGCCAKKCDCHEDVTGPCRTYELNWKCGCKKYRACFTVCDGATGPTGAPGIGLIGDQGDTGSTGSIGHTGCTGYTGPCCTGSTDRQEMMVQPDQQVIQVPAVLDLPDQREMMGQPDQQVIQVPVVPVQQDQQEIMVQQVHLVLDLPEQLEIME